MSAPMVHRLTKAQARRIAVRAQWLDATRPTDLVSLVERLTLLQIDPTSAIAPSADLVAWSRLGSSYRPAYLNEALEQDRTLFEFNAVVRPMRDLGLYLDDRDNMNHYWCYEARGPRVGARVTLDDQFGGPNTVRVTTPTLLCAPAEKVHGDDEFPIEGEDLHLACYEIRGKQKVQQFTLTAENQFETDVFQTGPFEILCAPAEKTLPSG